MTLLKQQISLIPFSIEHWYSPYKRRHFENWWDQTFCILLIKDVLPVIESSNLRQRQNLKQKWPGIRINLDPDVRRIRSKIVDALSRRRQSFRQVWYKSAVGCMRMRKQRNANKCRKIAYSSVAKKMKNRNPRADRDRHKKSTTYRGSPLARACQVWSTPVSAFVSYSAYRITERMKDWQRTIT